MNQQQLGMVDIEGEESLKLSTGGKTAFYPRSFQLSERAVQQW